MAMKCCTKLETAKERCSIVFLGHPSNFKVTRYKTSPILTQIGRFRTIGRSQLSNPSDLPCYHQWDSYQLESQRSFLICMILCLRVLWIKTVHPKYYASRVLCLLLSPILPAGQSQCEKTKQKKPLKNMDKRGNQIHHDLRYNHNKINHKSTCTCFCRMNWKLVCFTEIILIMGLALAPGNQINI